MEGAKQAVPLPPSQSGKTPWSLIFLGLVAVAALVGTYMLFVEPPPPRKIVIATGSPEGAYYKFATEYAKLLKKDGLELEVRATKGSVENLQLLQDDSAGVSVALVQSGVAEEEATTKLEALGSLYREPLWIFYKRTTADASAWNTATLSPLAGKRIAIGPAGSGTRSIALLLLKTNNILSGDGASDSKTILRDETGPAAAEALKKGEIDAAFFVASIEAPYIRDLLTADKIELFPMEQQGAYLRRMHFLAGASLPRGLVDLGKNIPRENVPLVAPTAMLVARKDLHPALVSVLLGAVTKVHAKGDLLSNPEEFPSPQFTDLPVSEDARHYFKSGPPVLQRFLPFWLASLVDRLKVMLIPLIMLMMPLIRSAPPLMRWRTRRKIYRWYTALRDTDLKLTG